MKFNTVLFVNATIGFSENLFLVLGLLCHFLRYPNKLGSDLIHIRISNMNNTTFFARYKNGIYQLQLLNTGNYFFSDTIFNVN